eukprot:scaffold7917_cov113-Isochrysis_galbana.AAC.2
MAALRSLSRPCFFDRLSQAADPWQLATGLSTLRCQLLRSLPRRSLSLEWVVVLWMVVAWGVACGWLMLAWVVVAPAVVAWGAVWKWVCVCVWFGSACVWSCHTAYRRTAARVADAGVGGGGAGSGGVGRGVDVGMCMCMVGFCVCVELPYRCVAPRGWGKKEVRPAWPWPVKDTNICCVV